MTFPVSRGRSFLFATWLVSVVAAVAMLVALLPGNARAEDPPAPPAPAPAAPAAGGVVDFPSAVVQAKATGKRVEVTAETTDSSSTWVNPDGTVTTQQYAAPIRFEDEAGAWQAIDTTLAKQADGSIAPKSADEGAVELAPSVAGTADAPAEVASVAGSGASTGTEAWSIALGWGGTLSAPSLKGSTATYAGAWPGIDLTVKASRDGFEQSFVVKDRASAEAYAAGQTGDQVSWDLPILVSGVSAREVDGERIEFVDASGAVVSTFEAPMAWDAKVDEASREHVNHASMGVAIPSQDEGIVTLRLTVDRAWLLAPDRQFPVTVDPVYAGGSAAASFDAFVQSDISTDRSSEQELKVGTYNGSAVARSFLSIPNAQFQGKQIMSAQLNLYETWSYSCTPSSVEVWQTSPVNNTARWTKQPTWDAKRASLSVAKGFSSACGAGWVSFDITGLAQEWSSNPDPTMTLGLRASSETSTSGWKRFASMESGAPPSVTFNYNRKPAAASTPAVSGAMQSGSDTYVGDVAPTVSTIVSDPDGNDVRSSIQVFTGTDAATKVSECTTGWVGSGQQASCALGTLPDDKTLYVRASVQDGNGLWAGVWSPWQVIKTAQATPVAPSITCPGAANGQWLAAAPPAALQCTVTAPARGGNNKATRIDYRVDGSQVGTPVDVGPGQSFTVSIPLEDGGHQIRARVYTASGKSEVAVFTTGWGGPSVLLPEALAASNGKFAVKAIAPPRRANETAVTAQMQWRAAGSKDTWVDAGSAKDVTAAVAKPTELTTTFDAAAALTAAGRKSRGAQRLEFQVCFAYTGVAEKMCTSATRPTTLVRIPHAFGDGYPTADVEVGQVALSTGELQMSATDASVAGYGSDITVNRSHLSYTGTGDVKAWPSDPVTGVFGPGFTANLEGDSATGLASMQVIDQRMTDATISLVGEDGDPLVFVNPTEDVGTPVGTLLPGSDATETSGVVATITGTEAAPILDVKQDDGTITRFTPVGATTSGKNLTWHPSEIIEPGAAGKTTFGHDLATGAVTRIIAPIPDGLEGTTCPTSGAMAPGCRAMDISYKTVTDPNGKQAQRVEKISAVLFNPATGQMETKPITTYEYDSSTRLTSVTDVRSGLKTTYGWEGTTTRIASVTPSGLAGYDLHYAANPDVSIPTQVFKNIQRSPQTLGGAKVQLASIVYDIPVSGTGLPDLSEDAVKAWNTDTPGSPEYVRQRPATGYAVFGSDHPVGALVGSELTGDDAQYASLQYTNSEAYTIDTASYGAGAWNVTATRYDGQGNVTRTLDAKAIATIRDRAQNPSPQAPALQAGEIDAMSTQTVYNPDIKDATGKVVTPEGTLVTDTYAPARNVLLADGTTVKRVRPHVHTTYDEGAPNGGINPATTAPYRLPTTVTTDAVDTTPIGPGTAPAVLEQLSVTHSGYDAIDGKPATDATSGWVLGAATTSTDALGRVTKQRFDSRGKVLEQRQPASSGNDAGTTKTVYYTAGPNAADGACGQTAQAKAWAGLPCATGPAAAPSAGPSMPSSRVTGYDYWLAPTTTIETSGTASRTSEVRYDAAGRPVWSKVSTSGLAGSKAMDAIFTQYNQTTGLVDAVGVSNPAGTGIAGTQQTTSYDLWGKPVTQVNELGDKTTTTYDEKARVTSVADPKGTVSFEYNGTDANGKAERRGSVTKQTVTRTGGDALVYTAAYDANGAMTTEKLPGKITATHEVDEAGEETGLTYSGQITKADGTVTSGPWIAWSQNNDAAGRVRTDTATFASAVAPAVGAAVDPATGNLVRPSGLAFDHRYTYDASGALTWAEDLTGTPVAGSAASPYTTREYTFTGNGARATLNEQIHADGTPQGPATAGTQQQLTYDTADRPTGGYVYDLFGRQTTLPAAHAPNPAAGDITLGYFDTDLPASITQSGTATAFTLDVAKRRLVQTSTTDAKTTTTTRHYTDSSDNPSWIDVKTPDGTTTTTRYASSVSGDLGASIDAATGAVSMMLPNIHGDTVTTIPIAAGASTGTAATTITGWAQYTEYGTPIDPTQAKAVGTAAGYGWLGAKERSTTEATAGLTLMGDRYYNRITGAFTSTDPQPGGNLTAYSYPVDPINMYDVDGREGRKKRNQRHYSLSRYWDKQSPQVRVKWGSKRGSAGGPNAGKSFTAKQKRQLKSGDGLCAYCAARLGEHEGHVDHIVPKSRGGNNSNNNAQRTCPTCNLRKGNRIAPPSGGRVGFAPRGIPPRPFLMSSR